MMLAEEARRQSLRNLLARCRTRLDPRLLLPAPRPADRGMARGLTQHEAARLLSVSPRQYGKLERGELTSPTGELLAVAAERLCMSAEERTLFYLFASGHLPPQHSEPCTTLPLTAKKAFLRMVEPHPALITDHAWNVLDHNAAVATWFTDPSRLHRRDRNIVLWLFTDEAAERVVDITEERRGAIARLRTACCRAPHDPALEALVNRVTANPEGAKLWCSQPARISPVIYVRRLRHPVLGSICSVPGITTALPGGQHLVLHLTPGDTTLRAREEKPSPDGAGRP